MPAKRCTATTTSTRTPRPCRAWAVPGSEARCGEPRCAAHGGLPADQAPDAGTDTPESRSVLPIPRPTPDHVPTAAAIYSDYFTDHELALLTAAVEARTSLEGEIAYARIYLRRLLAHTVEHPNLTLAQLIDLTPALAALLRTVGHLIEEERQAGDAQNPMDAIITEALTELSDEWQLDLVGDGRTYDKEPPS